MSYPGLQALKEEQPEAGNGTQRQGVYQVTTCGASAPTPLR
jgi:hypothetical protein